jgi:DNA repair protein RadC
VIRRIVSTLADVVCEATKRLKQAGEILGIPLVDHVVVGANDYRSLIGDAT